MPPPLILAAADRLAAVRLADEHGQEVAAEVYGVQPQTIKRWRWAKLRAERGGLPAHCRKQKEATAWRRYKVRPETVARLRSQGKTDAEIAERFNLSDEEMAALSAADGGK